MSSLLPRRMAATFAACLVLGLPARIGAQPTPSPTDTSRGLRIEYADGRVVTRPLRRSGGMWTPEFPRIPGADTARGGVALTTLDVKQVIEGGDVVLTVSLFYGGPGRHGVTVATVRVPGEESVQVNELRAYGVEPIRVSLVSIPPTAAYAPTAVSASSQLFVRAEAVGPNASAYRVVVTNDSVQPLMWLQFKAYRGGRLAILGRPRGKRNLPLVLPGAEYSFEITTTTGAVDAPDGSEPWQPLDRIEVTSLMWQDGVVEGEATSAAEQRRVDQNRAAQLRAVLEILRDPRRRSVASLRQQIAQGMSADLETRRARDAMLQELDAFMATGISPDAPPFLAWLTRTIADHEQWLKRIVQPGA